MAASQEIIMTNAISMSGPQVPTVNTASPDLMESSGSSVREGIFLGAGFVGLSVDQAGPYIQVPLLLWERMRARWMRVRSEAF